MKRTLWTISAVVAFGLGVRAVLGPAGPVRDVVLFTYGACAASAFWKFIVSEAMRLRLVDVRQRTAEEAREIVQREGLLMTRHYSADEVRACRKTLDS
jgi:hypothetical protein